MEDTTMIKKVTDFDRLQKQAYVKPAIQVVVTDMKQQMLAGSITSVVSTGLDAEEELILQGDGEPTTGNPWNNAW